MDRAHVRREDLPQHAPRALTPDEQKRLVRTLEQWPSLRDRAVVTLLLYTGIRAGECAALNLADVQISARRGRVIVREGKGNRYREVPLNAVVRPIITQWLHERAQRFPETTEAAVFLTRQGRRLGVRPINLLLHQVGTAAGIHLSAHVLRHTCLTNLVRQGIDLVVVAELAGHRRLDTTRRYTLPTESDRETAMEAIIIHDA
jgi:integrase/recombinase XerC